ncbi:hypothetical protein J3F83DRAFT_63509 [Trichoderma novae-zelandiae]
MEGGHPRRVFPLLFMIVELVALQPVLGLLGSMPHFMLCHCMSHTEYETKKTTSGCLPSLRLTVLHGTIREVSTFLWIETSLRANQRCSIRRFHVSSLRSRVAITVSLFHLHLMIHPTPPHGRTLLSTISRRLGKARQVSERFTHFTFSVYTRVIQHSVGTYGVQYRRRSWPPTNRPALVPLSCKKASIDPSGILDANLATTSATIESPASLGVTLPAELLRTGRWMTWAAKRSHSQHNKQRANAACGGAMNQTECHPRHARMARV